MGKRRVGFKQAKNPINALKNVASSDEEEAELEALLDDEIGRYHSEKDEALLKKGKKSKSKDESDNEEEVYGLNLESDEEEDVGPTFDDEDMDEDEDDEEDEDDDEDIFGKREEGGDGIPDSRAWGKKARTFHSTDYVDQDFGGMEGEDAERAQLEEEEAKAIQKRLMEELDEEDFMDFLPVKKDSSQGKKKDSGKEFLKLDLDGLSASERRKIVERECPEIPHLLEEIKDKLDEITGLKQIVKSETRPVLKKFYETKLHLLMNYCVNISFFLYQRSTEPQNCAGHPSIKKILQYRKLIDELKQFDVKKLAKSEFSRVLVGDRPVMRKTEDISRNVEMEGLDNVGPELGADLEGPEAEKRKITYEMSKNKGLMPKRKKEQRNPRVKHREKFRKAKVRRKGQIRTPRTEVQKYGGEMSGIKSNVTKSIKLR